MQYVRGTSSFFGISIEAECGKIDLSRKCFECGKTDSASSRVIVNRPHTRLHTAIVRHIQEEQGGRGRRAVQPIPRVQDVLQRSSYENPPVHPVTDNGVVHEEFIVARPI